MRNNNFKNKIFDIFIRGFFIFGIFSIFTNNVFAIEAYIPGESIIIGEFIYNDDYTPTADDCGISIYSPSLVELVNTTMTDEGTVGVTGWHYYSYNIPATEGKYPTYITCGSVLTGDLFKLDKSFMVKTPVVTDASIAAAVDVNTSASVSSAVTSINSNTDIRTGSLATTLSSLPATIWGYTSRTLTAFGSLAADVWNNTYTSARKITSLMIDDGSGDLIANQADVTAIKLKTDTIDWNNIATLVTEVGTGRIAAIKTSTDTINWADVNGIITTTGQIKAKTDDINWSDVTAILTDTGSIAWTDITGIKTNTDTIAWGDIDTLSQTASAIQVKTDTIDWGDIALIPVNTWSHSTRTLTSFGTLIADIWNYSVRSLTTSSPPQVIITSMGNLEVPNITANVLITNEGFTGFEYQYEWCVVSSMSNNCGGGDDVDYGSAAKFIGSGQDFNTVLSSVVPTAGNYYFKVSVFYGLEKSGASRSFIATLPNNGGGGGGGGGVTTPPLAGICRGADFNRDYKVDSVDFSILLSFWKTNPPFLNTCADINKDLKVDSVDFSILLSQWGTTGLILNNQ